MNPVRRPRRARPGAAALSLGLCLTGAVAAARAGDPQAPPSPALRAAIDRAEALSVTGTPVDAARLEISAGRLSVTFEKGRYARIRDGLGEAGLYVEGKGTARYAAGDPLDREAFEFNLRTATRLRPKDGTVEFRVRRMLILRPAETGSTVRDEPSEGPRALARDLEGALSELRAIRGWDYPVRRAAGLPVSLIALWGKARLLHALDAATGMERLLMPVMEGLEGDRHYETVSEQPLGPGAFAGGTERAGEDPAEPPPAPLPSAWTLSRLHLDLRFEKAPRLDVAAGLTLIPRGRDQRLLLLRLDDRRPVPRALGSGPGGRIEVVAPGREQGQRISVRSVHTAAGQDLDFAHRYGWLAVRLPGPGDDGAAAAAGEARPPSPRPIAPATVELTALLETELARLPGNHEYFVLREPGWFPFPAAQTERFALGARMRSRAPFRPILPGRILEEESGGGDGELRVATQVPLPVSRPVLACGKYVRTPGVSEGGPPVNVWTYGSRSPEAETIARFCEGALRFFSEKFGRYPFPRLDVLEAAPRTGGQSGPGVILVEGMDPAELARDRRLSGAVGFNMTFAHEVAHQWWGQKVGWKGPDDQWLGEALAEYSAWLFVRGLSPPFAEQVPEDWLRRARRSGGAVPLAAAGRLVSEARQVRADIIYGKGALMLRALAREAGEEKFLRALKAFADEFAGREAGTEEFVAAVSRATGRDLTGTYRSWALGKGLP